MSIPSIQRATLCLAAAGFLIFASLAQAGFLDDLLKKVQPLTGGGGADETIAGLKEALSVGAGNAVAAVGQTDGYFANQAIRILMPEKIQNVADTLGKLGYQKPVDDFVLSMNRAAEQAAPEAKKHFIEAVKEMTFDDAKKVLNGGDTAATDYLKGKTYDKIFAAFMPIVSTQLDQVGGTRYYKEMIGQFEAIPFMSAESLDLNRYVTSQALDGLFFMVGEEEKKIRTDPAARVTDLLKKVFGS